MVERLKLSFIRFYQEVITKDLMLLCTKKCNGIDWCELGCSILRHVTLDLANQHLLTDQFYVIMS
jgi:hypothetical protein